MKDRIILHSGPVGHNPMATIVKDIIQLVGTLGSVKILGAIMLTYMEICCLSKCSWYMCFEVIVVIQTNFEKKIRLSFWTKNLDLVPDKKKIKNGWFWQQHFGGMSGGLWVAGTFMIWQSQWSHYKCHMIFEWIFFFTLTQHFTKISIFQVDLDLILNTLAEHNLCHSSLNRRHVTCKCAPPSGSSKWF